MKSIVKVSYLLMLFSALIFTTSCQDEVLEIIQEAPEEVLTVQSEVAQLMQKTAINDGSKDNIIDNSSCFNVVLPVHVFVNSLEIIIDEEADFEVIEAIFDEFEDDNDKVDFAFPITIVLTDHEEVIIENQSQLQTYMNDCFGDNEEDDDIECIDFVYPISFSLFNSQNNLIDTKTVNKDREMYHFIKNIKSSDIITINFPVTVKLSDDSEIIIENLAQLEKALKEAVNSCDEDDDNDFGDDDFTKERLDNLLVKCPWLVHDLKRNNLSMNDHYREYSMKFFEDGKVKVITRAGNHLIGTWSTRVSDRGALLKMEFDNLVDFTLEWFVDDLSREKIKLFTTSGNRIVLEKKCDIIVDHTVERVKNVLKECFWRITRLNIEGNGHEQKYLGTPIKFGEENEVKLRIHGEFVTGTWEVTEEHHRIFLEINFDDRPELKLKWMVDILHANEIKLVNNNSKLIIKRFCEDDVDDDVKYIRNILNGGDWIVALLNRENTNKTELFGHNTFDFKSDGGILVEGNVIHNYGSYIVLREDGKLRIELNFGEGEPLGYLNNKWKVYAINDGRIELHNYADNGELEAKLVFEK